MPKGKNRSDTPSTVARSDEHAQEIWKKTHDSAVETYGEGEAAHRTAFASLKHSYKKVGDHWEAKDAKGPSDPQAAQGYRDAPKETGGGRVVGTERSKRELYEEAKRLDVSGRSSMGKEELAQAIHEANAKK
ncbi:MAG: ChaB family protein [Dehalococcoidia bacterium]|nr:ChaB family protein [Dehalococcoidia bacterium]